MIKGRVLFLGTHTDDEVSSAGTLTRFMQRGHEVFVAVFSFCEESSEALGHPRDVLEREFSCSVCMLGLDPDHILAFHYPVRHFPQHRQAILEDLTKLNKEIKPSLVIIPHSADSHQDHQVIAAEGKRAFTRSTILGHESPKRLILSFHMGFVKLTSEQWLVKEKCLRCYVSQSSRFGTSMESRRALAELRGLQAGCDIAEAFEVVRLYL